MEFERLVAYFDADLTPLERGVKRGMKLFDQLEARAKNFKGQVNVNPNGTGKSADAQMRQADIARMQRQTAAGERAITRQIEKEAESRFRFKTRLFEREVQEALRAQQRIAAAQRGGFARQAGGIGVGGVFAGSFAGTLAATAVTSTTVAVKQGGEAIFDYTSKLEQLRVSYTTLMGSAERANAHIEELQRLSTSTPLDFQSIATMSQRLQGAGVEAEKIISLISDIGNMAAATGPLTAERMEGIGVALSQIASKGKVSAEEMEQLAERGVPAWRMLSAQMGKSVAETRKAAEEGKITASELFDAFQKYSQMNFGGAMERQAQTFSGAAAKVKNVGLDMANKAFEPMYAKISTLAVDFSKEVSANQGNYSAVGTTIVEFIGAGMGLALEKLVEATGAYLVHHLSNPTWLTEAFVKGLGRGIGIGLDDTPRSTNNVAALTRDLNTTRTTVEGMPSVARKLESEKAADEAKKLQENLGSIVAGLAGEIALFGNESRAAAVRQQLLASGVKNLNDPLARQAVIYGQILDKLEANKKVTDIVEDLKTQVRFFGDETQVAATKQRLLNAGITEFTAGGAEAALIYAEMLDELKKTDEVTKKVENLVGEMDKLRADANFELKFPKATDLDRFSRWVAENRRGLSGAALRDFDTRALLTESALFAARSSKGRAQADAAESSFLGGILDQIRQLKDEAPGLQTTLKQLLEQMDLKKIYTAAGGVDATAEVIASKLAAAVDKANSTITAKGIDWDSALAMGEIEKALEDITVLTEDGERALFKFPQPGRLDPLIDKLMEMGRAFKDARSQQFDLSMADYRSTTAVTQLEAERQRVETLKELGATRETIMAAEFELGKREEEFRHRRAESEIAFYRDSVLRYATTEEQKLQIQGQFNAQMEAEAARHNAALQQITAQSGPNSILAQWKKIGAQLPTYQQQLRDFAVGLPETIGDVFGRTLDQFDGTWAGFLSSLKEAFFRTLQEMLAEMFRVQLIRGLTGLFGSIFGGFSGFGGGGGGFQTSTAAGHSIGFRGFAEGGMPPVGRASWVGEHGPEIFIPSVAGRVLSREDSMAAISGRGGDTYNLTVNQNFRERRQMVAPRSVRQQTEAAVIGLSYGTRGRRSG